MAIIKPNNNTLSAVTALPAAITTGKVLQVVQGTHSTESNTNSTSQVATGTDLDITPSATSSKIFVQVSMPFLIITKNDEFQPTIYRDSTNIALNTTRDFGTLRAKDCDYFAGFTNFNFLDSPNTTSQIHYEMYVKRAVGSGSIYLNYNSNGTSTITAFEIGA